MLPTPSQYENQNPPEACGLRRAHRFGCHVGRGPTARHIGPQVCPSSTKHVGVPIISAGLVVDRRSADGALRPGGDVGDPELALKLRDRTGLANPPDTLRKAARLAPMRRPKQKPRQAAGLSLHVSCCHNRACRSLPEDSKPTTPTPRPHHRLHGPKQKPRQGDGAKFFQTGLPRCDARQTHQRHSTVATARSHPYPRVRRFC
jgi:hypothetical protein